MTLLVKSPVVVTAASVLYPVHKKELVQAKIAFSVRWRERGPLLRDLRFYCQFHDIHFQISSDGGWWHSRHVLTVQGEQEQIDACVMLVQQLLTGQAMFQAVR